MTVGPNNEGVWVVVVAAGAGSRFGAPKQFLDLCGTRVVDRSIATAGRHAEGVVVVLPPEPIDGAAPKEPGGVILRTVAGGTSRAASVRHGLEAVPDEAEIILVHDGARPLASDEIFVDVIAAVRAGADAAVPAVPVTDTIRRRGGGVVDRADLVEVQTPQGFRAASLRAAHAAGGEATDDATLVETAGGTVVLVDGDRCNLKLTTPLDLDLAAAMLDRSPERDA
jgi:2-C-methyl-D-erythritol 4-phosphate cytidylyltransferase